MKTPRPDGSSSANEDGDSERILQDWIRAVGELYQCYHQLSRLLTDDESISCLLTTNGLNQSHQWVRDDLRRLQRDACIQLVGLEQGVTDRNGKPN